MSKIVSDVSANRNDKIFNAAEFLSRSKDRKKVFEAIYRGKRDKKVSEIMNFAEIGDVSNRRVRTNQELKKLRGEDMVELLEEKKDGEQVYRKKDFYTNSRDKIISLSKNNRKRKNLPTKINPKNTSKINLNIKIPKNIFPKSNFISIESIDQFKKIKKIQETDKRDFYEKKVKEQFKKLIGETGKFTDWGGEKNDLFTTNLKINGKRFPSAFAFKGKGTSGILTPKKMGKNGDQIQRLFQSPAEVFFIQYNNQIDQSILEQMEIFAKITSMHKGKTIYYGIVNGSDTNKIMNL